MNTKNTILLLLFVLLFHRSQAQVHEKISDFTLRNLVDDKDLSLLSYKDVNCVVIIFISDYCPYSKSYKDRISKITEDFASDDQVKFLVINPANSRDKIETLKEIAKKSKVPYLLDEEQKVTKMLGATKTPEVFVLQKNLDDFVVKYHGAIDDNPQLAEEVSKHYLKDAIEACRNKKNLNIGSHKPTGCNIKVTER